jgi:ribosomal protein S4
MVVKKPFVARGLIDLSWKPLNLFNSYRYAKAPPERDLNRSAFQLRWRAKQLTIPYHAGHVTQRAFRRTLPRLLPQIARPSPEKQLKLPFPPTTMLTYAFMERRLDTVLFRSCFVSSIWEARAMCRVGAVTVNGKLVHKGAYVLEDGDIVQLKPDRSGLLRPELRVKEEEEEETDGDSEQSENAAADASDNETKEQDASEEEVKKNKSGLLSSKDYGFHPLPYMAPWIFVPEYLEVNFNILTVCFLRSPMIKEGRCEIPSPYDEVLQQRTFDFYGRGR